MIVRDELPHPMNLVRETLSLADDLHLSYRSAGTGEPVVLLHGLADHGGVWQALMEGLGDRYRWIAPDLRGHGESSKPSATAYDSRRLATDLETLAQRFALDAVHVVAHSWAAKIALLWARRQPQRLRSLVLVDPFFVNQLPGWFRPTFPILYRTLPFLKVMGPFPTYEAAVAIAQTLKQYRGWSPLQEAVFRAGMEQKPDGRWGSKFAIAARNGVFEDIVQLAGLTEPLAVPTCLLLPETGLNRTVWQIRPYKRYLTDLTIESIPGNHWPHLVAPEPFQRSVAEFLATH